MFRLIIAQAFVSRRISAPPKYRSSAWSTNTFKLQITWFTLGETITASEK